MNHKAPKKSFSFDVIENSAAAAALFLSILLPIVARGKQKIFLFFIFEDPLEQGHTMV